MDYARWSKELKRSIGDNYALARHITLGKGGARSGLEQLPPALRDYYTQGNGFDAKWWKIGQPERKGRIRILPLDQVLQDGKGVVWFDHSPARMRDFKLIDFFADEAAVGFFLGKDDLYLYEFAGNQRPSVSTFTRTAHG